MTRTPDPKPLARCLGEFVGHIVRAVRTSPSRVERREVARRVEESRRGPIILRRTTIDEIEHRPDHPS